MGRGGVIGRLTSYPGLRPELVERPRWGRTPLAPRRGGSVSPGRSPGSFSATARGQFSSRWKRIVLGIGGGSPSDLLENGRPPGAEFLNASLAFKDVRVDLFAVLEVVGERGVHGRESQAGMLINDLVWAQTLSLMPDGNVRDGDAMPGDARSSPPDFRRDDDARLVDRHIRRGRFRGTIRG